MKKLRLVPGSGVRYQPDWQRSKSGASSPSFTLKIRANIVAMGITAWSILKPDLPEPVGDELHLLAAGRVLAHRPESQTDRLATVLADAVPVRISVAGRFQQSSRLREVEGVGLVLGRRPVPVGVSREARRDHRVSRPGNAVIHDLSQLVPVHGPLERLPEERVPQGRMSETRTAVV